MPHTAQPLHTILILSLRMKPFVWHTSSSQHTRISRAWMVMRKRCVLQCVRCVEATQASVYLSINAGKGLKVLKSHRRRRYCAVASCKSTSILSHAPMLRQLLISFSCLSFCVTPSLQRDLSLFQHLPLSGYTSHLYINLYLCAHKGTAISMLASCKTDELLKSCARKMLLPEGQGSVLQEHDLVRRPRRLIPWPIGM